jgi:hypothetical protein
MSPLGLVASHGGLCCAVVPCLWLEWDTRKGRERTGREGKGRGRGNGSAPTPCETAGLESVASMAALSPREYEKAPAGLYGSIIRRSWEPVGLDEFICSPRPYGCPARGNTLHPCRRRSTFAAPTPSRRWSRSPRNGGRGRRRLRPLTIVTRSRRGGRRKRKGRRWRRQRSGRR